MQPDEQLLQTKLAVPVRHPHILPRDHLIDLIAGQGATRLVLACAPAGFGKTTLLSAWCRRRAAEGGQCAWITLDGDDNDADRFVAYLCAALDSPGDDYTRRSAEKPMLTGLINALAAAQRDVLLVLDDYHVIETPAIHHMVAYLLEHQPTNLCIAIGSREVPPLPIARLRAREQLVELHAAQLAFTPQEIQTLDEIPGETRLSAGSLQAIADATEGWPAGVNLYLRAMRQVNGDALDDQQGTPSLYGGEEQVFAFLADDIFECQPAYIKRFLLETSIVERISPSLCDTLMGVGTTADEHDLRDSRASLAETDVDSYSRLILRDLERRNIFLIALDYQHRWYRYHRLLRAFLLDRLAREPALLRSRLHRRASEWYARFGFVEQAGVHRSLADALGRIVAVDRSAEHRCPARQRTAHVPAAERWLPVEHSALPTPNTGADTLPQPLVEELSARELEVLALVADGASNQDIATALVISQGTVKSHMNHILGKLAAQNRTEAVAVAHHIGLLAP